MYKLILLPNNGMLRFLTKICGLTIVNETNKTISLEYGEGKLIVKDVK